jgi:hypothetical protein
MTALAATRELDPRPGYKDAAKRENVTKILYYAEKTILMVYPQQHQGPGRLPWM